MKRRFLTNGIMPNSRTAGASGRSWKVPAWRKFALAVVAGDGGGSDKGQDALLPEARAKVVRDYLTQNFGLDDARIKTLSGGKTTAPQAIGNIEIRLLGGSAHAASGSNLRRELKIGQQSRSRFRGWDQTSRSCRYDYLLHSVIGGRE